MPTVKAMIITVDSLPSRPKLDCDVGYDAAVKGVSVVVNEGGRLKLLAPVNGLTKAVALC